MLNRQMTRMRIEAFMAPCDVAARLGFGNNGDSAIADIVVPE